MCCGCVSPSALTVVEVCHHHPLPAGVLLHLAGVAVHVAVAGTHHAVLLPLTVSGAVKLLLQVAAGSRVSQLHPGPAGGFLQLAHISICHPVISAHKAHFLRATHPLAGFNLVQAFLQWNLLYLLIPC